MLVLTYLVNHFPLVQGDVTAELPDRGAEQEPVYVRDQGLPGVVLDPDVFVGVQVLHGLEQQQRGEWDKVG